MIVLLTCERLNTCDHNVASHAGTAALLLFTFIESLKSKAERSDEKVKRLTSDLKKTTDKLQSTKSDRNRREVCQ